MQQREQFGGGESGPALQPAPESPDHRAAIPNTAARAVQCCAALRFLSLPLACPELGQITNSCPVRWSSRVESSQQIPAPTSNPTQKSTQAPSRTALLKTRAHARTRLSLFLVSFSFASLSLSPRSVHHPLVCSPAILLVVA
ncbi:hypothetical protein LY76DRAFT_306279 [Colletotrichum caudatum]|nr:hypothetical protein LY76DRAFT_306279 [Colletotrichum caudatum]